MNRPQFRDSARRRISDAIAIRNSPINDPERLAALRRTGLLDSLPVRSFDRFTRLASLLLRTPAAVVSLVDDRRQFFKSHIGLPEPWATRRETPLSHSFCRHVVEDGRPLIIDDVSRHERLRENPAIKELQIAAYAGIPLQTADGHVLGSLCVIDRQPRVWKPGEIGLLSELAASVMTEIALQTITLEHRTLLARFEELTARHLAESEANAIQNKKREGLGSLGGVAHEFGNVLGAILGNADLARQEIGADHPASESIERIFIAGNRARELVKQTLAFARNESARRDVLALRPVVEESARLLRATLPRNVNLIAISDGDAPNVQANATQVEQAIANLVTNACHSLQGQPGSITIALDSVTDAPGAPAGLCARLIVRDSGKGMDAATLERIFEPFFTTKTNDEGTGLGLSIVHDIMQAHQGAIQASSQPGQGSAFTLFFPTPTGEQSASPSEPAVSPCGQGGRIRMLDDEGSLVP